MPDFSIELSLTQPVIGIDEVGRGPLAGPVVSCACIFLDYQIDKKKLNIFDDSKKLNQQKRKEAMKLIYYLKKKNKLSYSLGLATVKEIDSSNIFKATKTSMIRAVKKLNYKKANLIIDGKIDLELIGLPSFSFVKGDQKSITIAAASIIAKVHRDRYMRFISCKFPKYNWGKNSGYGTKKHIEQIVKEGVTIYHRKTFEPIKSLIPK